MNNNFLNREQVVAKFKLDILPSIKKEVGDDFDTIQYCWYAMLDQLVEGNRISSTQRNKWKLKEEDLI